MKNKNTAILDLMTEYLGIYDNPHGVELTTDTTDAICLGISYPGETFDKYTSLELVLECDSVDAFVRAFQLKSVSGIDNITANILLAMYHQGKANISCLVEDDTFAGQLMFRKQQALLLATNEDDVDHEVPVRLETPQQFIAYTQRFYHVPVSMKVVK